MQIIFRRLLATNEKLLLTQIKKLLELDLLKSYQKLITSKLRLKWEEIRN